MLMEKLKQTVSFIQSRSSLKPEVGIILGSGLGRFSSQIQIETTIPYNEIPHFSVPSVEGHHGQLLLGHVGKTPVVCLQGRIHYYEGHPMDSVVYPTRTLASLGIKTLFVTNAAGGVQSVMEPGDLMIITDHINLMGVNPLIGPNEKALGPRFPDMTEAYNLELQGKMEQLLRTHKIRYHKGVYCALTGPTYETPAEVNHVKIIGGSAVGMSTVPEVIVANHMGLKVCGISCITNKAAGISKHKLSHEEVTETAKKVETQFAAFVKDFISSLTIG